MKQFSFLLIVSLIVLVFPFALLAQSNREATDKPADASTTARSEDNLVRSENGTPIKLIVTQNNAVYEDAGVTHDVNAFVIFHQLTPKEGKDGKYRFGSPLGKEVGWIEKKYVDQWKTTTGYDPVRGKFEITDENGKKRILPESSNEEGVKQYVLICDNPTLTKLYDEYKGREETPEFEAKKEKIRKSEGTTSVKVVAFIGNLSTTDSNRSRLTAIDVTKLDTTFEFVYVIDTTKSMEPLIELAKDVTKATAEALKNAGDDAKGKIRFGIVEYRDAVGKVEYRTKQACELTDDFNKFSQALNGLECSKGGSEDIPEEVYLGLQEAIKNMKWQEGSKRHIILLGDAPAKGKGEKIVGTSGLSRDDVIGFLYVEDKDPNNRERDLLALESYRVYTISHQMNDAPDEYEKEAAVQFKELARKPDRYYNVIASDPVSKERAIAGLGKVLVDGIGDAKKIQKGEIDTLSEDTIDALLQGSVLRGTGAARTETGDRVAATRYFLARTPVQRQLSALKSFVREVQRNKNNPKAIVASLKDALGETISASVLDENTEIASVCKDFPLQLQALNHLTPGLISRMDPEAFQNFVNQLRDAIRKLEAFNREESKWILLEYPKDYKDKVRDEGYGEQYQFIAPDELDIKVSPEQKISREQSL